MGTLGEPSIILSNTNRSSARPSLLTSYLVYPILTTFTVTHGQLPDFVMSSLVATATKFRGGHPTQSPMIPVQVIFIAAVLVFCIYSIVQFLRPFVSLYGNVRRARAIGLPMKVIPFPPGLFSFFVFQILRRLGLLNPGTKLHRLLNMGRPDGYGLHKEMGDVFLTVSPAGLTLIVADPKVATHVNSKRVEFPKPPNTGGKSVHKYAGHQSRMLAMVQ
jgi:hypothetical protein